MPLLVLGVSGLASESQLQQAWVKPRWCDCWSTLRSAIAMQVAATGCWLVVARCEAVDLSSALSGEVVVDDSW